MTLVLLNTREYFKSIRLADALYADELNIVYQFLNLKNIVFDGNSSSHLFLDPR